MLVYTISIFKIFFGLLIPNKKHNIFLQFGEILLRITWEIPQTIFGLASALFLVLIGQGKRVIFSNGATILKCKSKFGGFTLGNYVIGDSEISGNPNQRLFQHEYGHYLQSQKSGPIYLFKYGLPSLISSYRNNFYVHSKHPVEIDANIRAKGYWDKHYEQKYAWDMQYNPIYKELKPALIRWYDFIPVYFPFAHLVIAFKK